VGSVHQEDHKNGQATGQKEQSPALYSTTMVMEMTINTLNHARNYLRADKMGSTEIFTKWPMGKHENNK